MKLLIDYELPNKNKVFTTYTSGKTDFIKVITSLKKLNCKICVREVY